MLTVAGVPGNEAEQGMEVVDDATAYTGDAGWVAPPSQGDPMLPGPTFAGPYHAAGDPASAPFTYGRFHNPAWTCYEQALSALEGGPAVVFASGMACVAAVLGVVLRPHEVVVVPADSYYTTRVLANGYFAQMGVDVRMAPTAGNAQQQHLQGAKLLWLETPSNPGLDEC